MFALDTNTLIYFFKGLGSVASHLLDTAPAEIAIPSVVLFELEVGIARSNQPTKRRVQLDALLSMVTILQFETAAAKRAAEISASLQKRGMAIGPMDSLIAGTVLTHGATLVTHNVSEFRRIQQLQIEDWY